jgi:glutamate-1-semialdehyde aminotransferase
MHVNEYITHVRDAEENLSLGLKKVIAQHVFETDVVEMCNRFQLWSEQHLSALEQFQPASNGDEKDESFQLFKTLFANVRTGPYGLLRDLHALSLLIHEAHTSWTILHQAAMAIRNNELKMLCEEAGVHLKKESMWAETRIKNAAAQILVVG